MSRSIDSGIPRNAFLCASARWSFAFSFSLVLQISIISHASSSGQISGTRKCARSRNCLLIARSLAPRRVASLISCDFEFLRDSLAAQKAPPARERLLLLSRPFNRASSSRGKNPISRPRRPYPYAVCRCRRAKSQNKDARACTHA